MRATNGKVLTKIVSFVLSVLLLFYAIPGVVYSETIDALSESSTEIDKAGNAERKNHIINITDESGKLTDIGNTTSVSAGDNVRCGDVNTIAKCSGDIHCKCVTGTIQHCDGTVYVG